VDHTRAISEGSCEGLGQRTTDRSASARKRARGSGCTAYSGQQPDPISNGRRVKCRRAALPAGIGLPNRLL
jgi:hypothetical protein